MSRRRGWRPPPLPPERAHERLHGTLGAADPFALALRTAAAVELAPDRHWPRWLERQVGSAGSRALPLSDLPLVENRTGRTWTTVGAADGARAHVDPAGLIVPDHGRWAVDWLVGAGDRWVRPAGSATRQRRTGAAPAVETVLRLPSGELVHRAYVATGPGGRSVLVLEVHNAGSVPVALALVVGPAHLLGVGTVGTAELRGATVLVDGAPALALDAPPNHAAGSTSGVEVGEVVAAGRAAAGPVSVRCRVGLAELATVVPLVHGTTRRAVVALDDATELPPPGALPDLDRVRSGWDALLGRAARLVLPDPALQSAADAVVADLVVAGAGGGRPPLGRTHDWTPSDAAVLASALAGWGMDADATRLLLAHLDERDSLDADPAVLGDLLAAVGEVTALTGDEELVDAAVGFVGRGVRRIERAGRPWLTLRRRTGWRDLARALDASGQDDLAAAVRTLAERSPLRPAAPPGSDDLLATPGGTDLAATVAAAGEELLAGDGRGHARLGAVLGSAAPTGSLPTALDPRLGVGCRGSGHDPTVAAGVADALRSSVVADREDVLGLLPVLPPAWLGAPVEVHGLPTRHGRVSYALRWHGARPALLWEVEDDGRHPTATVVAPAIDRAWSSPEARGEALLAAPPATSSTPGPEPAPGAAAPAAESEGPSPDSFS